MNELNDKVMVMTRYRKKTVKRIQSCLNQHKALTIKWTAYYLEMEYRVVRNYFRRYPEYFKVVGKESRSDLWAVNRLYLSEEDGE